MGDIKRGVIISFDNTTYTASVQILEATSTLLTGVPVATHCDGTSAVYGANCAVLFFDEQNPTDALVIGMYPNGSYGVPVPPPGRIVMLTAFQSITNDTITVNTTKTYTLNVGAVPTYAIAVLCKIYFYANTAGASIEVAPHGATLANYVTVGNIQVGSQFCNDFIIIELAGGQIDIHASGDNAQAVNLFVHGYVA